MRVGLGALLLAGLVLLSSCQMRPAGLFTRNTGLICYVASDGNIAVIDPRSGGLKSITADAGTQGGNAVYYVAPTWSPDAKRLAFAQITLSSSGTLVNASLVAADAAGGRKERLLSGTRVQPFYLFWSPDSRSISLLSQVQGEDALELGIAMAGGVGSFHGVDRGAPYYWDWLKNSQDIVAHTNTGRTGETGERLSLLRVTAATPRADLPEPISCLPLGGGIDPLFLSTGLYGSRFQEDRIFINVSRNLVTALHSSGLSMPNLSAYPSEYFVAAVS